MNRRDFTLSATCTFVLAACGGGRGRPSVSSGTVTTVDGKERPQSDPSVSNAARTLHRRALVLDGNLAPPTWYPFNPPEWNDAQVTSDVVDTVRKSGLTAMKLTLGGFNSPFEVTVAEIAAVQRLIEARGDVFTQIRRVDDIDTAKRAHKLGIIFSFESAAALEDKVDALTCSAVSAFG